MTPGPVAPTVPIRIDSAAEPGLGILDGGLVAAARGLQRGQRALQFGDFGVQRRFTLMQRVQQHQQIRRTGGVQRVTGVVLVDLGGDGDTEQQTQHHRQRAENRAAAPQHAEKSARLQLPDLGARLVRPQFVPAVLRSVVGAVFVLLCRGLFGFGSGLAGLRWALCPAVRLRNWGRSCRPHACYAPNSRRRRAAALPKMRMPSTTMIAVDNCVPTPNWSPT